MAIAGSMPGMMGMFAGGACSSMFGLFPLLSAATLSAATFPFSLSVIFGFVFGLFDLSSVEGAADVCGLFVFFKSAAVFGFCVLFNLAVVFVASASLTSAAVFSASASLDLEFFVCLDIGCDS